MNCIVFILLSSFSVAIVFGLANNRDNKNNKIKCDSENRHKADSCADKLWFVGKNARKFPETQNQMQKHCKQTTNLIKCVKDFTDNCAKGVQKQLANVMLYTVKMNQKQYCTKSVKRDEVVSFSFCGNAIRDASSDCMEEFLNGLGKAKEVDSKNRVPTACCSFHQMKSCIMKAARKLGGPVCTDKPIENLERYIDAMAGNTLNLMCNEYEEDSDKCSQLPSFPKNMKHTKAASIIVGFGELLENL